MSQAASRLKLQGSSYQRVQFAVRFKRYCEPSTVTASSMLRRMLSVAGRSRLECTVIHRFDVTPQEEVLIQ